MASRMTSESRFVVPIGGVLGLFGKQPMPGRVKTRLARTFGDDWAARCHEAMLFDALEAWGVGYPIDAQSTSVHNPPRERDRRRVFGLAPDESHSWFAKQIPDAWGWELCPQGEGDLGNRMARFFDRELARPDTERAVLIGSDSPTLLSRLILEAFDALIEHDLVLGPSTDGGYYLIGMSRHLPELFEGVAWSTSTVLGATVESARRSGLRLAVLDPWYDIDAADDLYMMVGHMRSLEMSGNPFRKGRLWSLIKDTNLIPEDAER